MLEKLKNNYGLSIWLARTAYVLLYVFVSWRTSFSLLNAFFEESGFASNVWLMLLLALITGIVSLLLVHFLTGFVLNMMRFFFLPRQEFTLLVVIFLALKNLILGALNCLYFITPVIGIWGELIFPVIAFLISGVLFYMTVEKYYLNSKTAPIFFKALIIIFCVLSVLFVIESVSVAYGV